MKTLENYAMIRVLKKNMETSQNTEPIIRVDKLRIIYNQGKSNEMRALEETSLEIYDHEYVIIFGPSGCGKSTLLYSISGLQASTYGSVSVGGKELGKMTQKEQVHFHQSTIGMVFQAFYLISSLTILDNVVLPKVFRGEDPTARKEVGMSLMRRFGIIAQADKFPNQLSGGQKQRVAIARSLVNDPGIILADEPVGNLDSESAENVLAILKDLNEVDKKTIIMVTHNPEHLAYADRVIFMKDGRVVKEEINRDKRPSTANASKTTEPEERFSKDSPEALELQMLMESFKNLLPKQVDILLIPFKAKQLLSHIVSEMNDEQISMAEALLKERLFNNIDSKKLERSLDMSLEEGGGGWNNLRAISFTKRVEALIKEAAIIKEDPRKGLRSLAEYLVENFHLKFTQESWPRFVELLKLRIENQMGQLELLRNLDAPIKKGGVGLNRITAEKLVREIEIILLLKYS